MRTIASPKLHLASARGERKETHLFLLELTADRGKAITPKEKRGGWCTHMYTCVYLQWKLKKSSDLEPSLQCFVCLYLHSKMHYTLPPMCLIVIKINLGCSLDQTCSKLMLAETQRSWWLEWPPPSPFLNSTFLIEIPESKHKLISGLGQKSVYYQTIYYSILLTNLPKDILLRTVVKYSRKPRMLLYLLFLLNLHTASPQYRLKQFTSFSFPLFYLHNILCEVG